jgi:hypothetical protein
MLANFIFPARRRAYNDLHTFRGLDKPSCAKSPTPRPARKIVPRGTFFRTAKPASPPQKPISAVLHKKLFHVEQFFGLANRPIANGQVPNSGFLFHVEHFSPPTLALQISGQAGTIEGVTNN